MALAIPAIAVGWPTITVSVGMLPALKYAAKSKPGALCASAATVILLYVLVASRLSTRVQLTCAI